MLFGKAEFAAHDIGSIKRSLAARIKRRFVSATGIKPRVRGCDCASDKTAYRKIICLTVWVNYWRRGDGSRCDAPNADYGGTVRQSARWVPVDTPAYDNNPSPGQKTTR